MIFVALLIRAKNIYTLASTCLFKYTTMNFPVYDTVYFFNNLLGYRSHKKRDATRASASLGRAVSLLDSLVECGNNFSKSNLEQAILQGGSKKNELQLKALDWGRMIHSIREDD